LVIKGENRSLQVGAASLKGLKSRAAIPLNSPFYTAKDFLPYMLKISPRWKANSDNRYP
jgi:hypothetical protein